MRLLKHSSRYIAPEIQKGSASALGRFGKYKKEEHMAMWQAEVNGSFLEELRRKREMLRSMTTEQAISVIEFYKNLTVIEAITLAKKEGKLIVSDSVHDRILETTLDMDYFSVNHAVWTGTMMIYQAPGKPFGDKIIHSWEHNNSKYSISFDVPVCFRMEIDCVLIAEHPDFDIAPSRNKAYRLITDESRLQLHRWFPVKDSELHKFDGNEWKSRSLWRTCGDFIGLAVRGERPDGYGDYDYIRGIYLVYGLSHRFGIALF